MEPIIVAEDLTKVYISHQRHSGLSGAIASLVKRQRQEVLATENINLHIRQGELVGFLGPNGAGKTTTLKMLSGILFPTSGSARVMGYIPWERRTGFKKIFSLVMGQKNQLWWDLPAEESFLLLRELYEIPKEDYNQRLKKMTHMLEIDHLLSTQVRKLSLGERMKCELVAALLHRPKVVFLDEPTIGLDVVSQKRIREFIKEINREEGATIVLTSHYMEDVNQLCERVIIIDKGHVIFDDRLSALVSRFTDCKRINLTFNSPVSRQTLENYGQIIEMGEMTACIETPITSAPQTAARVLAELPVLDIEITGAEVEDVIRDIFLAGASKRAK